MIEVGRRLADDPRVLELLPDLTADVTANLGTVLVHRFVRRGRPEDLTEALHRVRAAVNSAPGRHIDYHTLPLLLIVLAVILRQRALVGADHAELDEAIAHLERAAALPGGNAVIAHHDLGMAHTDRYERTGDLSALERSIREHQSGLQKAQPGSPIISRPDCPARGRRVMSAFDVARDRFATLDPAARSPGRGACQKDGAYRLVNRARPG